MSRRKPSAASRYRAEIDAYVAAGGNPQVQRVVTLLHGLHRKLAQWYTTKLADVGLSEGEWRVIAQLATAPDEVPLTPSHLADTVGIAPSSMTHRLDRMTERGLIQRTPDTEKRTRVLVRLTDDGWQMFRTVIQSSEIAEADALQALSPAEQDQLGDLLETAIASLDASTTDEPVPVAAEHGDADDSVDDAKSQSA